ncbi:type IV secretory system conjugative DNA transfer family protein [Parerythrobacter lacustris]|uniref:Type IV secretion system DNA-binding domain-containing protein n=1 Tax=Parerythrobacter lacustris TaxID=2969984 RepID=A0ABT1XPA0_9SPHN|nr:DUF87 domain-containing protein [Parerythrobacter lacustris]MCR2833496.1 type IV secretion system DNA-binding domain-containing protein [Parerythrobacter lacustris]
MSTYTPLFRRFFGNERSRELQEVRDLYHWVKAAQDRSTSTPEELIDLIAWSVRDETGKDAPAPLLKAVKKLVTSDTHIWNLPPPAFERMSVAELVEYRSLLHQKQYFLQNIEELEELQYVIARNLTLGLAQRLPETEAPSPFTIPLIFALENPRDAVDRIAPTLADGFDRGLFAEVSRKLYRNLCRASGRDPEDERSRKPLIGPDESPLPLAELVETYFKGTPFQDLLLSPVPLKLRAEDRFNHWHVVGGTGAGKTTLIENLILHDLKSEDRPALVVIDPHGDLIRKLTHADLGLEDRLILIDPRDTKFPVALNPFAVNRERLATYDESTREQVTAGVIQTFGYLFSGLTNLTLTGKQEVFFRYVTRLMLSLPDTMGRNATILDMLHLMSNPAPYEEAIEQLPEIPREFFRTDFKTKTFEGTKEQIRYRLQAIIENPTMARLFTAPETKVDFFTELNRGAVILVDTAKDFLKEGSSVFGKLLISLILQAILERAAIPEGQRKPAFISIDEAGSFFSQNIDDLLTEARKYKAGLLLAHQYLDQATGSLRSSFAANTGIKFASGLSANDARQMAPDMRTTPDFILAQPRLQFAAHIRHVTPGAVSIPVEPVRSLPQLDQSAREELLRRNRERVSLATSVQAIPNPQSSDSKPDPADDWVDY